ncbi:MAG TPA: PH domain-containing protein [Thermoanaerobaculaceae bacterium]|nr:PH domain-containing protein [Thermoanaerobaculaceae bacterium]
MNQNASRVFRPAPVTGPARVWFALLSAAVVATVVGLLVSLLRTPTIRYEIDNRALTITSVMGSERQKKTIDLARIAEAKPEWLHDGVLRFGTEKPGYCVGFYSYPRVGEVWQITDCSAHGVVVTSSAEATPVAVTPADPDAFLKALREGRRSVFAPPERRGAAWWVNLFVVTGAGALAIAALAVVLFVAPARLRYTIGTGALEVGTLLRRRVVPLAGTRAQAHRPLSGQRLAGFPLPGYRVGSWMLDNMATSVLASAADEGVLIEGEGRLFVNPADREGFLAALAVEGCTIVTETLRRR